MPPCHVVFARGEIEHNLTDVSLFCFFYSIVEFALSRALNRWICTSSTFLSWICPLSTRAHSPDDRTVQKSPLFQKKLLCAISRKRIVLSNSRHLALSWMVCICMTAWSPVQLLHTVFAIIQRQRAVPRWRSWTRSLIAITRLQKAAGS